MPASLQDSVQQPSHTKGVIKSAMKSANGLKRIWCVVEADDDVEVYEKFFNSETLTILPSTDEDDRRSCHNVEVIVTELYSEENNPKLFGIRDRDYTSFSNTYICPDNVFLTDDRDLEMMMLKSTSVTSGLEDHHQDFPKKVYESAEVMRFLGYLRIYNDIEQMSCTFKKNLTKVSLVWDEGRHSVYPDYKDRLLSKFQASCSVPVDRDDMDNFITDKCLKEKNIFEVCRGHDVCRMLCAMMIKHEFSSPKVIFQWMKDSYSFRDFKKTMLYEDLMNWSNQRALEIFST